MKNLSNTMFILIVFIVITAMLQGLNTAIAVDNPASTVPTGASSMASSETAGAGAEATIGTGTILWAAGITAAVVGGVLAAAGGASNGSSDLQRQTTRHLLTNDL